MTLLKLSLASACLFLTSIVGAQELSVFNDGFSKSYYIDDHKISRSEFVYILKEDRNVEILWKKASRYHAVAIGLSASSMGFAVWSLQESANIRNNVGQNRKSLTVPIVGMLGSAVGSIVYSLQRNRTQRTAILAYNKAVEVSSFLPILETDKIGLVVTF